MALEDTGLVIGRPNGLCPRHGTANITVDGHPACLHCDKEAAKAQAVPVGVNDIEDPGEDAMKGLKTATAEDFGHSRGLLRPGERPPQAIRAASPAVAVKGGTFEEQVGSAVATLRACPMPKNLKSYKAVAKAVALLEKLLQSPTEE